MRPNPNKAASENVEDTSWVSLYGSWPPPPQAWTPLDETDVLPESIWKDGTLSFRLPGILKRSANIGLRWQGQFLIRLDGTAQAPNADRTVLHPGAIDAAWKYWRTHEPELRRRAEHFAHDHYLRAGEWTGPSRVLLDDPYVESHERDLPTERRYEQGVSVLRLVPVLGNGWRVVPPDPKQAVYHTGGDYLWDFFTRFAKGRELFLVRGDRVEDAYGADGEPLLEPESVRLVGKLRLEDLRVDRQPVSEWVMKRNPTEYVSEQQLRQYLRDFENGVLVYESTIPPLVELAREQIEGARKHSDDSEQWRRALRVASQVSVEIRHQIENRQAIFPGAWKMFIAMLRHYQLAPKDRRKLESAVRFWSRKKLSTPRIASKDYFTPYERWFAFADGETPEMHEHLDLARRILEKGGWVGGGEEGKIKAGPFLLVNSGGFKPDIIEAVAEACREAASLMERAGIGHACYGEVYVVGRVSGSNVVAQYERATDALYVRASVRRDYEYVRNLIHEIGHRLVTKFGSDEAVKQIQRLYGRQQTRARLVDYELPPIGETLREANGEFIVTGYRGRSVLLRKQGEAGEKVYSVTLEGYARAKGKQFGLVPEQGFVTAYATRSPEENFCEMVSFHCSERLPAKQQELLEPVFAMFVRSEATAENPSSTHSPSWANQILNEARGAIEAFAQSHRLPMVDSRVVDTDRRLKWQSYGCGSYGCVYATQDSAMVAKLTSDPSEVLVARRLLDMGNAAPRGVVRYFAALNTDMSRNGSDVWLLWRESADRVGEYAGPMTSELERLQRFALAAKASYDSVGDTKRKAFAAEAEQELRKLQTEGVSLQAGGSGTELVVGSTKVDAAYIPARQAAKRFAHSWTGAILSARRLAAEGDLREVGDAVLQLADEGILLADVRQANLGQVSRGARQFWAIIDPGFSLSSGRDLAGTTYRSNPVGVAPLVLISTVATVARSIMGSRVEVRYGSPHPVFTRSIGCPTYAWRRYVSRTTGEIDPASEFVRETKVGRLDRSMLSEVVDGLAAQVQRHHEFKGAQAVVVMPRRSPDMPSDMDDIGQALAKKLDVPFVSDWIVRTKEPARGKTIERRLRFPASQHAATMAVPEPGPFQKVILLDNVIASGNTMRGAIEAIRRDTEVEPVCLAVLWSPDFWHVGEAHPKLEPKQARRSRRK